jgi:hypothetical protein
MESGAKAHAGMNTGVRFPTQRKVYHGHRALNAGQRRCLIAWASSRAGLTEADIARANRYADASVEALAR